MNKCQKAFVFVVVVAYLKEENSLSLHRSFAFVRDTYSLFSF